MPVPQQRIAAGAKGLLGIALYLTVVTEESRLFVALNAKPKVVFGQLHSIRGLSFSSYHSVKPFCRPLGWLSNWRTARVKRHWWRGRQKDSTGGPRSPVGWALHCAARGSKPTQLHQRLQSVVTFGLVCFSFWRQFRPKFRKRLSDGVCNLIFVSASVPAEGMSHIRIF